MSIYTLNNNSGCKLVGSLFTDGVQLLLGLCAFMSLLIKWRCENKENRRSLKIFLLDGSKQGISSLFAHIANMVIAMGLSKMVLNTDQCAWYFVSYLMDTIMGVSLAYLLLKYLTFQANKRNWEKLKESGDYGPIDDTREMLKYWAIQLFTWIGIIFFSRLFTGLVLIIFRMGFADIANGIAFLFKDNPNLLLIIVMVVCPGIINLFQVWIQDNILKKSKNNESDDSIEIGLIDNSDL